MKKIYVIKSSGKKERYKHDKLKKSLVASKLNPNLAEKVIKEAEKDFFNNITTSQIHKIIEEVLKKYTIGTTIPYNIKRALFALGPTGFPFEKFVARILQEYNYKTKIDQVLEGKCVQHEVDIVATKDNQFALIECKFHNSQGTKSNVKTTLYVYARFIDIIENKHNFPQLSNKKPIPWIFTNTRFTGDAIKYALCKGIRLTAWHYPAQKGIQTLIEKNFLYPITVFTDIPTQKIRQAFSANLVVIKDILDNKQLAKQIFQQDYLKIILKIQDLLSSHTTNLSQQFSKSLF